MKIICIGKNHSFHTERIKKTAFTEPYFFIKPETAVIRNNLPFFYPDFSNNIHCEVQLVLKICKLGKHISEKFAHTYYNEIGTGINFTAKDIQEKCINNGMPWEIAKAFDGSTALGTFIKKDNIEDINSLDFGLNINKNNVQQANSSQMILNFDKLISYISKYITLKIGDLIFTGTPSETDKVNINDTLEASFNGKKALSVKIK